MLKPYCRLGESESPNAGFFDFIGYQLREPILKKRNR